MALTIQTESDLLYTCTVDTAGMLIRNCASLQEEASSTILDIITTKIGLATFLDKLEGLTMDRQFQIALQGSRGAVKGPQQAADKGECLTPSSHKAAGLVSRCTLKSAQLSASK